MINLKPKRGIAFVKSNNEMIKVKYWNRVLPTQKAVVIETEDRLLLVIKLPV